MLAKKLCCVKVLSIAKAVKTKQYCSPKRFEKSSWFFRYDIRYWIIRMDFLIFKFKHNVLNNYFIYAETGVLDLFLISKKEFRVIIKLFIKKLTHAIVYDILQPFTEV